VPHVNANSTERLHALDATRGFALLLGVVFHATLSFLPAPPGAAVWIVMDSQRSLALAMVFFVSHIFRMTTFFLIAGFFAHMSFHRKGARGFVLDRLKRIGIPLVVGQPILFALIVAATIWGAMVMAHGRPLPKAPAYPGFPAFPLTHLWFLYVLLLLYTATLVLRGVIVLIDRSGRLRAIADAMVRSLVESPFGFILLALPTAAALYLAPQWLMWFGIPTPDSSLVPNAGAAIGFGTAFAFGWLVHRQTGLLEVWKRRWLLNLVLAIGLTVFAISLTGMAPVLTPASHDWRTAAYAVAYTLATWSWTFAVIGTALRFLSRQSAVRRYIADASYWIYVIHVPLIMALQVAVSQLAWPWWVKFPLILGVAFSLMFASYQLFVRYSFIGAVLNGRRTRPSNRVSDPVPAPVQESLP
jgi:peptidoglycan/LPS O-acetylase OafA/YrhL